MKKLFCLLLLLPGVCFAQNAGDVLTYSGNNWTGAAPATASGIYSNQTATIAGTSGQITSSAGAQNFTANRTWTLSLPDPLVAPGVITGNGSGVTNAWVKEVIVGSLMNSAISTGSRFTAMNSVAAVTFGTVGTVTTLLPIGGYLTNFQVYSTVAWPSTTNIVFTVQTNRALTTPVSTPITCTLRPGDFSSNVYTNSGTTSLVLPSTQDPTGFTWALNWSITSSGGNLASQSIHYSIERWHQSP